MTDLTPRTPPQGRSPDNPLPTLKWPTEDKPRSWWGRDSEGQLTKVYRDYEAFFKTDKLDELKRLRSEVRALREERDRLLKAYQAGYSDAEREISGTALGQSAEAAHAQNHQLREEMARLRAQLTTLSPDAFDAFSRATMEDGE